MEMTKKKIFYIFLFINALLWSCVQLMRNVISIDAMEAISWGELLSFGTNKHPPFSGWLMGGFYNLFGQHDFIAYFLGQACILVGFIFIYKLAKFFISEEKAMCASMILSSCYYYTYIVLLDNFNCNFVSIGLWPMIAYYFYKSIKENKIYDWIIFGVTSGVAVLTKYQAAFLFLGLLIYLLSCERKQFKQKGIYLAVLSGFIVILPHIVWLFQNDFFSFIYMAGRTALDAHNTPHFLIKFGRIVFPIKFYLDQILSITSCIAVYLLLALQAKNITFKNEEGNKSDKIFLLSVGVIPILLQGLVASIENSRIMGIWGSIMVGFTGILLFYFFPIKFNKDTFSYFMKWAYTLMFLWIISMVVFMSLQTKRVMSYPHQKIMKDFDTIWAQETNNAKLKYVGGNIDYIFQFRLYNSQHPRVILETFGYKNPWINHEDVLKSGVIILGKTPEDLFTRVKDLVILLPENYEINPQEYSFDIKNKFNKTKHYNFYYVIIPPLKH